LRKYGNAVKEKTQIRIQKTCMMTFASDNDIMVSFCLHVNNKKEAAPKRNGFLQTGRLNL
jgi:hypothetical protein